VELNLYSLAVNSLLKMATLEDMEGQDLDVVEAVTKDNASAEPISHADNSQLLVAPSARLLADDKNATRAALKILCSAVATWFADVVQNRNPFADALLSHLYRWLRSSVSCLYDPALHRLVHRLMKKVFVQLLAELKRLGARVVYASFSKLIIVTGKHSVSHALTYVQYARNTIMTRDLFQYLALEPARYFEQLVFMDAANYSAVLPIMPGQPLIERPAPKVKQEKQAPRAKVRAEHDDDEMNSQDEDEYEDEEAEDYGSDNSDAEVDPDNIENEQDVPQTETSGYAYERVLANWNVATYLPDLARRAFLRMAAEFIWLPYRYITEHQQQVSLTQAHNTQTDSTSVDEFLQSLVEGPFSHRLFSMVQSIIRVHPPDARAGDDSTAAGFPYLPGSHLPLTNPALEFIKYTTHLMSLDPTIQSQIRLVKANLLKLVDVRPFAVEAEYRNPCATFVLPDVICSFCNECHDLDICRDPRLVASLDWRCEECRQPYDRSSIEFALVTVVQRRSVAYQIQDLVCQRCRLVKVENMAEFCKCSGSFRTRESAESFAQSLRIFRNIAKIYQFPWLEETVKFVLQ
jgi:DNA polymerase epsilon subunit 1